MSSDYQRFAKSVIAKARKDGWEVTIDGRTHYKLRSPNGKHIICLAGSSRSLRGMQNAKAKCRRAGLEV